VLAEVTKQTETTMRWATRDLEKTCQKSSENLVASLRESTLYDNTSLKQHFDRLIIGLPLDVQDVLGKPDGERPEIANVHGLLQKFDERLESGVCSHQQAEQWRQAAEKEKQDRHGYKHGLEQSRGENSQLQDNIRDLESQREKLNGNVLQLQETLKLPVAWEKCGDKLRRCLTVATPPLI